MKDRIGFVHNLGISQRYRGIILTNKSSEEEGNVIRPQRTDEVGLSRKNLPLITEWNKKNRGEYAQGIIT